MNSRVWAAFATLCVWGTSSLFAADLQIHEDIVYGHKDGMALTYDVVRPEKPNGAGVLHIQSGGWYSPWTDPKKMAPNYRPFLDKGFTVFIVRHGSAPKYAVPDAVEDMRKSVQSIRLRSSEWSVDPDRLGTLGGSAGGHLSLILATTGVADNPKAPDAQSRQSTKIAAAVALYPPTDLRGWIENPPEAIKVIPALKPPLTFPAVKEVDVSPIVHVTPDDAPMLMIHGDQDQLVPISHSHNIMGVIKEKGAKGELIVIEGAGHSFTPEQNNKTVQPAILKWFETHLAKKTGE